MRKYLNGIGLAGMAMALATTPAIVGAQDETMTGAAPTSTAPMAPQADAAGQDRAADKAQKQAAMEAWPAETRAYYESLSKDRQKMFWSLSDSDKVALSQLPEDQRESTWAQIESRMAPSAS